MYGIAIDKPYSPRALDPAPPGQKEPFGRHRQIGSGLWHMSSAEAVDLEIEPGVNMNRNWLQALGRHGSPLTKQELT